MSQNIAVETTKKNEAVDFYSKVLGFNIVTTQNECTELNGDPFTIYIQNDESVNGIVMELFVEDLEMAKQNLLENGCKIIRWLGKNKDCYIEDPFGVRFNIWEVKTLK